MWKVSVLEVKFSIYLNRHVFVMDLSPFWTNETTFLSSCLPSCRPNNSKRKIEENSFLLELIHFPKGEQTNRVTAPGWVSIALKCRFILFILFMSDFTFNMLTMQMTDECYFFTKTILVILLKMSSKDTNRLNCSRLGRMWEYRPWSVCFWRLIWVCTVSTCHFVRNRCIKV